MDYDFKDFKPMIFDVDVRIGRLIGDKGSNSVSINDKPFIIQWITHQIKDPYQPDPDPNFSVQQQQDGLYRIDWSLYQQERYWQGTPPMADTAFGSVRHGRWIRLPAPVALEKNRTINVDVTNEKFRHASKDEYTIHIEFHGLEDWRVVGGYVAEAGGK